MKSNRNILRKCLAILAVVVSAAFIFEACAKEPSPLEEGGRITMTTKATTVRFGVVGAEDITINWGDGKKSNVKDALFNEDFGRFVFTHDYSSPDVHSIVITGSNVIRLYCSYNELIALDVSRSTTLTDLTCSSNQLIGLDVSRNTALTYLNCNHNQITRLDVSKNTALSVLHIVGNQLTAAALNDLFRSLPDNTKTNDERTILIAGSSSGNPGNLECDRSIATKKGWGFFVDRRE